MRFTLGKAQVWTQLSGWPWRQPPNECCRLFNILAIDGAICTEGKLWVRLQVVVLGGAFCVDYDSRGHATPEASRGWNRVA